MQYIKKRIRILSLLALFSIMLVFVSCGPGYYDPDTMHIKSEEQILEYMNSTFDDHFYITYSEDIAEEDDHGIVVHLYSDSYPYKTIVVKNGWYEGVFGWESYYKTNYFAIKHEKKLNEKHEAIIANIFNGFEYKLIQNYFPEDCFTNMNKEYATFSTYYFDRPYSSYILAIKSTVGGVDVSQELNIKLDSFSYSYPEQANKGKYNHMRAYFTVYKITDPTFNLSTLDYDAVENQKVLKDFELIYISPNY